MATVYVLGSGASKALIPEAPLNDDLLPALLRFVDDEQIRRLRQITGGDYWPIEHELLRYEMRAEVTRVATAFDVREHRARLLIANAGDDRLQRIKQFISRFYGIDPAGGTLPQLEEVLSQIDYAITNPNAAFSRHYATDDLRYIRESIVYGIGRVLQYLLEAPYEYNSPRTFLNKLTPEDTIISLNYDLIIDNAILLNTGQSVEYGLPIRSAIAPEHGNEPQPYRPPEDRFISPLYKLHGSLNWLYCPRCQQIDITEGVKGIVYIFHEAAFSTCSTCNHRYEPVVITPTFLKSYDNPFLEPIWQQAETTLNRADRIVFVGYSLPDADMVLRSMFKRAIFTNEQNNGHAPEIIVVDYDEALCRKDGRRVLIAENAEEHRTCRRYRRLFGPHVTYDPRGFLHYIKLLPSQRRR